MRNTGFLLPLIRDIESILRAASVGLEETEARVSIRTQQRIRSFHAFNTLCSTFLRATANTSTLRACVRACVSARWDRRPPLATPVTARGAPTRHRLSSRPCDCRQWFREGRGRACARAPAPDPLPRHDELPVYPTHAHTYDAMLPCVSRGDAVAAASSPSRSSCSASAA